MTSWSVRAVPYSGGDAIMILPSHPALENAHHVPALVKYAPLIVGTIGIAAAYVMYIARPDVPDKIAARFQGVFINSCSTNGTSTSFTTRFSSVQPLHWAVPFGRVAMAP